MCSIDCLCASAYLFFCSSDRFARKSLEKWTIWYVFFVNRSTIWNFPVPVSYFNSLPQEVPLIVNWRQAHHFFCTVCIFDIHEFLRLRCRYPQERSQSRCVRDSRGNSSRIPRPKTKKYPCLATSFREPSGCNNRLDLANYIFVTHGEVANTSRSHCGCPIQCGSGKLRASWLRLGSNVVPCKPHSSLDAWRSLLIGFSWWCLVLVEATVDLWQ